MAAQQHDSTRSREPLAQCRGRVAEQSRPACSEADQGRPSLQTKHSAGPRLDKDAGLVVRVGRKDLLLLCGDGGVARDEARHDAARRLEAHAEGRDIEQQQVLHLLARVARQDCRLQPQG